jgi:hypothetical protein
MLESKFLPLKRLPTHFFNAITVKALPNRALIPLAPCLLLQPSHNLLIPSLPLNQSQNLFLLPGDLPLTVPES